MNSVKVPLLCPRGSRELDTRASSALRAAAAGSWQWDLRSMDMEWSEQTRLLYGLGSAAPSLEQRRLCIHPDDRTFVETAMRRVVEGRVAHYRCEFRVQHPMNGVRWLIEIGRLTHDDFGIPVCMVGITLDITGRKDTKEAWSTANTLKDEFIVTLSHELRNAVAPILSAAAMLERGPTEKQRSTAQHVVLTNARHLRVLLDDMSDPSKMAHGEMHVNMRSIDLRVPLRQALEQTAAAIQDRGHRLRMEFPESELLVLADTTRLVQVFSNLLWNAVKYTPFGGEIVVRARSEGVGDAVVDIQDNGAGIAASEQERVFDLFTRAQAVDSETSGLGIGLALVRRLVKLHAGHVCLESAGLGRGSKFSVTLPRLESRRCSPLGNLENGPTSSRDDLPGRRSRSTTDTRCDRQRVAVT